MTELVTPMHCFLVVVGLIVILKSFAKKSKPPLPLPPGPKGLPFLGNLLDMPSKMEWLTFSEWGRKWGDIVSVSVLGQQIIILNSAQHAVEMLDKKSLKYSDRPILQMAGELAGYKNTLVLSPYGSRFRNYRKMIHQFIGSNVSIKQCQPIEEMETHRFLKRILHKPNDLGTHIRTTTGAIILRISHGYEIEEMDDPFIALADVLTDQFSIATAPGAFLVDFIPSLRRLPDWFPGAGFKKTAELYGATLTEMVERPHNHVKRQMAAGTAGVSFTSSLLADGGTSSDQEFDIKWAAVSLYSGGADTTVATIHAFFKAMVLFPGVQSKAQVELDAVVGNDRLPGFADRDSLPYINALVLEALRWHSVAPTGVPHRVTEDDVHDGYFIPKGSLVIANIWQMTHDPKIYADPMAFNPDRFIALGDRKPEPDPQEICFGFGRRICPGRILADASLFIACAMTLAVFNVSQSYENGVAVEPTVDQTTGTISHPSPFQCTIRPRSEKAATLIAAAGKEQGVFTSHLGGRT